MENTANAIRTFLISTQFSYVEVYVRDHWDGSQFVFLTGTPWENDARAELLSLLRHNFCGVAFIDRVANITGFSATPS